jgi:hypothetical protein
MTRRPPKTAAAAARKEIDTFAARLLALSGGRTIPREWKQYLLRALAPKRSTAGRKLDLDRYIEIATEIALLKDEERTRSKHNNPADHRRAIAKRHGVSEKTVRRIEREFRSLDDLDRLDAPRRKARIEALAAAVSAVWAEED